MTKRYTKEKEYEISSVEIIKKIGGAYQRVNFFPNFVDMTIYQDMFNSTMSGKITFNDATDIPMSLPITGDEFIEIGITYPDTELFSTVTDSFNFQDYEQVLLKNIDEVVGNITNNLFSNNFVYSFISNILSNSGFPSISNLFSNFLNIAGDKKKTLYMLFRVYKLDEQVRIKNKTQEYTLRLVSPEYMWNLKTKLKDNYTQQPISSIVSSFFTYTKDYYEDTNNELFKNKKQQDALIIEETLGLCNYSGINGNPFKIINNLASRAISKTDESSNYVFFQNNAGFNFRSLSSIFKQANTLQFFYRNPNLSVDKQQFLKYDALNFEVFNQMQSFNILDNLRQGLYANKLTSVDYLRGKWYEKEYKIQDEYFKFAHADDQPFMPFSLDGDMMDAPPAKMLLAHSSKEHDVVPHLISNDSSLIDEKIEQWLPNRKSQMMLLNQNKTYARLPGHPSINAGMKCRFDMPDAYGNISKTNPQMPNKYLQGSYVISACSHYISRNEYECEVELIKDSFYSQMEFIDRTEKFR